MVLGGAMMYTKNWLRSLQSTAPDDCNNMKNTVRYSPLKFWATIILEGSTKKHTQTVRWCWHVPKVRYKKPYVCSLVSVWTYGCTVAWMKLAKCRNNCKIAKKKKPRSRRNWDSFGIENHIYTYTQYKTNANCRVTGAHHHCVCVHKL